MCGVLVTSTVWAFSEFSLADFLRLNCNLKANQYPFHGKWSRRGIFFFIIFYVWKLAQLEGKEDNRHHSIANKHIVGRIIFVFFKASFAVIIRAECFIDAL